MPALFVALLPDEPAFTIVAASDAYLRAIGKSREEVAGLSVLEIFAANVPPQLSASLHRVLITRQPETMPAQHGLLPQDHPHGVRAGDRYWSAVNSPVLGDEGAVRFIIHKLTPEGEDVEEAPHNSETRFSDVFAQAPIGMVLTTPEGRILETNQAYLNMLGYTHAELASRDSAHFTHPDDIAPTRQFYASLQNGSLPAAVIEKRYLRKDGQVVWARASATMRRDRRGASTQLIAIIEDITERKRTEERLRESQDRLRAIYDGAYEYIGLLAPDGTLLEANGAALQFAGNTREEVIGRLFWDTPWFTGTPGAPEAVRQGVGRAAAGEFVRHEVILQRPSGEFLTFDFSLHPVRNERGEVVFIVPEGRDITGRKAADLRDAFLVWLDDSTRPLTDPHEITQTAARLLGEHLEVNRCAYADVEEDQDAFNLTGDYNRGVPSIVGRYRFAQFGDDCLRLLREGKAYVVEDSETDPRVAGVVDSYRLTQIRSVVCVPLLKSGRLVAAMAVHQTTPRQWRQDDLELVRLVANRCWESIERAHVARELQEREQRLRFLAESIPQMVWTATPDGMLDYVNGQGTAYFGVQQAELLGVGWLAGVHPAERELAVERWKQSLTSSEPYETAFRLRRGSDESWRWHLVRALPLIGQACHVMQWFGTCTDIEDQKQAESNLRQQWQTFDAALSHTPDFTYVFDLEGRFTYVNRSLLSLWQRSLQDAVGKNFFELDYPPQLAERLQRQIQQVIDTNQPLRDQTPFTGPTGETRYYDYILVPVLDGNGRVEAVTGSTRDVTEQNQAAGQIEEDRRRWRDLLLQTPAAIAVLRGPEHTFEWANPDYVRLVGRPTEALVGKTVREALPEVEGQIYVHLLDVVYRTGEPFVGHEALVRLGRRDGDVRESYVNFIYLATRDVAGEIDGIFAHATDVTEMVLARKQVEESERQFRTLAETIPHLAWMADETGYIFWYNRRWYDYTGSTFEEMQGWGWQKVHDAAVLPDVLDHWRAAIASGEPFEMVFPLKSADSLFRPFLTRVEPVHDDQGRVVRWFGTNTDITDQRKIEEDLRRANRELEEFAYVASHDLQEPLRMVNIYTQLILKTLAPARDPANAPANDPADRKLTQYSAFVRQGVTRMEALIQDLLTFSRTVHTEELPIGTADLSAAFHDALLVLKNRIEETGAVIQAESLPLVRGDTAQIAHVFQNLLSNALKYRKPDVPPQVRISVQLDHERWIVSVRDHGIGFESQYAERIFGLFKRLHKDEYPGTGLGLAICKRIVERYGGRMWAEGQPGEGATFCFSLPTVD